MPTEYWVGLLVLNCVFIMSCFMKIALVVFLLAEKDGEGRTVFSNDFYFGFMRHTSVSSDVTLCLQVLTENSGTIDVTVDSYHETLYTGTITDVGQIDLSMHSLQLITSSSSFMEREKGIHVYSSQRFSLVVFSSKADSSDAYIVYPHVQLPDTYTFQYYVIAEGSNQVSNDYLSETLLVGCEDNTSVIISPTVDVMIPDDIQDPHSSSSILITAGSKHTVILHRMQTLLLGISMYNLTGSEIASNKAIIVISGHECARTNETSHCNFLVEQMPPTATWGRNYVIPYMESNEQYAVIVSSQKITTVNVVCNNKKDTNIFLPEKGDNEKIMITSPCVVTSAVPILVSLLIYNDGSAVMSLIPPIEQYSQSLSLKVLDCSFKSFVFINTINNISNVLFNGETFLNGWTAIQNTHIIGYTNTITIQNNDILTLISELLPVSAIVLSWENCPYAFTAGYELNPLPVPNITLSKQNYSISENEGMLILAVQREEVLDVRTVVNIISDQLFNAVSNEDYQELNEEIVFEVGENSKQISIIINNDEWVEPPEKFTVRLVSSVEVVVLAPFQTALITIMDDDSLTVGLLTALFNSSSSVLQVQFGIISGLLQAKEYANIMLNVSLRGEHITYQTVLFNTVFKQDIHVNLSELIKQYPPPEQQFLVQLSAASDDIMFNINPNNITGTLNNTTSTLQQSMPVNFIVSEFTVVSLLITTIITSCLVFVIALIIFVSVIVCISLYRYGRKWSMSGRMDRLFTQGDAISLSTNDPETYELMNRLGEKKTGSLMINDDNEYI